MQHSKVVGGSTAKRVINCPGSVPLVQRMPPQVESKYAAEGTMLHDAIDRLVDTDDTLGQVAAELCLTDEQIEKLTYCVNALDQIDPERKMVYATEIKVEFEGVKELEGVFGHTDMLGRIGNRAIVLDWKFGDGVTVEAEESEQGLFYAAAARKTHAAQWAIENTTEVEIIIVQPFQTRRWVTTWERVEQFERDLINAVKLAKRPDAPMAMGDWCRWCTAKPVCPLMTGEIERMEHGRLAALAPEELGRALALADRLESFIEEARKLSLARLEKGLDVPGYKLVPKRATRKWADDGKAVKALLDMGLDIRKTELMSPAQAETALKKSKLALPDDLVVAVSSGNTIAPESDPRPAVVLIGERLKAALSRVQ